MWNRVGEQTPPQGEIIRVMTPLGHERTLIFENGRWWLPDRSTFVYYTPVYWKRMGT